MKTTDTSRSFGMTNHFLPLSIILPQLGQANFVYAF
jgi:hypothetical protein